MCTDIPHDESCRVDGVLLCPELPVDSVDEDEVVRWEALINIQHLDRLSGTDTDPPTPVGVVNAPTGKEGEVELVSSTGASKLVHLKVSRDGIEWFDEKEGTLIGCIAAISVKVTRSPARQGTEVIKRSTLRETWHRDMFTGEL